MNLVILMLDCHPLRKFMDSALMQQAGQVFKWLSVNSLQFCMKLICQTFAERNVTNGVASHKSAASEASAKKAVPVTKSQKAAPREDDIVEILSSDDDEHAPDQV